MRETWVGRGDVVHAMRDGVLKGFCRDYGADYLDVKRVAAFTLHDGTQTYHDTISEGKQAIEERLPEVRRTVIRPNALPHIRTGPVAINPNEDRSNWKFGNHGNRSLRTDDDD